MAGAGVAAGGALGLLFRWARGDAPPRTLLRPPGAGDESDFLAACIRCQLCVTACPYDTLRMAGTEAGLAMGTPYLVPRDVPCYLCEELDDLRCVAVCPTQALQSVARREDVRMGVAVIDKDSCTAYAGAICRACFKACPISGAIVFDGLMQPIVREDVCVGCGLCDHACPTQPSSIHIRPAGAAEDVRA